MADGIVTTLVENVVNTLNDATTYTNLSQIKGVKGIPEFRVLGDASPWVAVVPGSPVDEQEGVTGTMWWQPITCYIGLRRMASDDGDWELLGDGSKNGLDTLAKDVRQALNRPRPFQSTGSGYVAQTGVKNTRFAAQDYMGPQTSEDGQIEAQVVAVTIEYYCVDERDA